MMIIVQLYTKNASTLTITLIINKLSIIILHRLSMEEPYFIIIRTKFLLNTRTDPSVLKMFL